MPQVKLGDEVPADFERFKKFLQDIAPEKIEEVIDTIIDGLSILEHTPYAGEPHRYLSLIHISEPTRPY